MDATDGIYDICLGDGVNLLRVVGEGWIVGVVTGDGGGLGKGESLLGEEGEIILFVCVCERGGGMFSGYCICEVFSIRVFGHV